jgi:hypothetical protein
MASQSLASGQNWISQLEGFLNVKKFLILHGQLFLCFVEHYIFLNSGHDRFIKSGYYYVSCVRPDVCGLRSV